jgi:Cu-Zn family superoxide dismutase
MRHILAIAGLALVATAAYAATPADPSLAPRALATAEVVDAAGAQLGVARIIGGKDHPQLRIELSGVPAGVHAMHLHAVGACTGTAFADAGPHLNPANHQHGTLNPLGSHLGDLPNVTADATGHVKEDIELPMTAGALLAAVIDQNGTALVLHAGPDDYRTDPAGGSGARIACGVFKKS